MIGDDIIMKNNLLLKSVIFLVIFIVVKIILNLFSLEFIKWVYIVSFFIFVILWTLGWFQYINDINIKWLKYICVLKSVKITKAA